jgi:hypothetical protein
MATAQARMDRQSDSLPEPGFARREAPKERNKGRSRRYAGSVHV